VTPQRLVHMATQIAVFFRSAPPVEAVFLKVLDSERIETCRSPTVA
jgi:hypothetical protein